jgi:dihydrolipoamide dehydrogenase
VNYATIPSVIYTAPEIAWVGPTEQALKAAGTAFRKGVFWFKANARAQALGESHGFVKVLADDQTDRILGVHMIGPRVSNARGGGRGMEFAAAAEDRGTVRRPTLSEALHERPRPLWVARVTPVARLAVWPVRDVCNSFDPGGTAPILFPE